MLLAKAGYHVIVLERRARPLPGTADRSRTFMLALGERGLKSLDSLGITLPAGIGCPIGSSVYALKSGKRVDDFFSPGSRVIGVDRQGLSSFLVDQAAQQFPNQITFLWETAPARIDLPRKLIAIQATVDDGSHATGDGSNNTPVAASSSSSAQGRPSSPAGTDSGGAVGPNFQHIQYDILIGADGAGSAVRDAMLQALGPDMQVSQLPSPVAELEYKSFHDLPGHEAVQAFLPKHKDGSQAPGMTFFAFTNTNPKQPTPGSLTLYINSAGNWSGTLFQPVGTFTNMSGVADHEAAIRQFLPDGFPKAWISHMAAQMMAWTKPGRISPMKVVSRLAAPQLGVALVGDAAHSVTPQMGQGCNSALEDCRILAKALESSDYDVSLALSHYQQTRTPQVHALQHMEQETAWIRRPPKLFQDPLDKTLARIAWTSFFILLPLLRLIPGVSRAIHASMFQNIISTTTPYDKLHNVVRVSPIALGLVLAGFVWCAKAAVKAVVQLALMVLGRV
eukprot:GHRR01011371.1.p1 GENE.GHRR01011371.1~~GHRR01011371.1.p1  ORF type:complete len:507 (+),score=143.33 GHRR01011371.1:1002-2522(+)